MPKRDDGFDLCGEKSHRGNWYSSAPSGRFCTVVRRHNDRIERKLDKSCGYSNLALCHGASIDWAKAIRRSGFDGYVVDGEFALTTRWGAHNSVPHEWLVVRKAAANGRALLFDPTAKQYWQDLGGRLERFRRSRYRSRDYDKIEFEDVDDFEDYFGG